MEKKKVIEYETQYIKGVGPKRAEILAKVGLETYEDLLTFFPTSYIDRNSVSSIKELRKIITKEKEFDYKNLQIKDLKFKTEYSAIAQIEKISEKKYGLNKKLLVFILSDGSGEKAKITFFNRIQYFLKSFQVGDWLIVSGIPDNDKYYDVNFTHPEIEKIDEEDTEIYKRGGILPKYKLPEIFLKSSINQKSLRKIIFEIINTKKVLPDETLPEYILNDLELPKIEECYKTLHFPDNFKKLEKARYRIKFEESLLFQLALKSTRKNQKVAEKGIIVERNSQRVKKLYRSLPYELTNHQINALKDIFADFTSGKPMNRLLQGDVGSGKTIVSIFSMLAVIDAGYQVAFMAPTELLVEQHYNTLKNLLKDYNVNIIQLVGNQKKSLRNNIYDSISSGEANIICGTHALFQSDVQFNKLGLVVIDEQHRFGVSQRAELIKLAKQSHQELDILPHTLVMSATPIPRTLTMTVYGDLDLSVIKELPKNRIPIKTKVVFEYNRIKVYEFIENQINEGRQVYIVYPLIEKSEKLDLKAATEYYEHLKNDFFKNYRIGLLHGQLAPSEKEDIMKKFLSKEYDILVSTTVIEVGIDVANASVMVIENAERFGLSQLHQLRGRIGRGPYQSYCFLFTKDNFQYNLIKTKLDPKEQKAAIIRLKAMEETSDGFKIAEIDLQLRGPGDILGTRQSGLPYFRYLDIVNDVEIISFSRNLADNILKNDKDLSNKDNLILKMSLRKYLNKGKEFMGIA
jgi:ATP-dependent DNA helicase RecG